MLNSNHDYKRLNRANLAVRGRIFSKLNLSSINKIETVINDCDLRIKDSKRILDLLNIARQSNECATSHLLKCQTSMCINVYESYATQQYKQLVRAEVLRDDYNNVESISKFIITTTMHDMNKMIIHGYQSGKNNVIYSFFFSSF